MRIAFYGAGLLLGAVAILSWPASSVGQNKDDAACVDPNPYKPRPAFSGNKPKLPPVPTLPNEVAKQGADFTVLGALTHLRSPSSKALASTITVVAKAATAPKEALPSCTKGWPTGTQRCHLLLEEGGAHILVIVDAATKTPSPVRSGEKLRVTGRYDAAYGGDGVARFDPLWGVLAATEITK